MRHRIWLVAIISLALAGCHESQSNVPKVSRIDPPGPRQLQLSDNQLKEVAITTCKVESRIVPEEIELVGEVDENDYLSTPVNSLVPGLVERVEVQLGDRVHKGKMLAKIRSDEVARIESDLIKEVLEFEADIAKTNVELGVAQKALDRHKQLYEEGIGARAQLEIAQGEFLKAQASLQALQEKKKSAIATTAERLELYGINPTEIERLLKTRVTDNLFEVFAPREGMIVKRDVDVGQQIEVTHQMFIVSDLSQVWVNAQSFEKDIKSLELGEPVVVTVESYPGRKFPGKVDYIGSMLDPKTRTLAVRATVPNLDGKLHPKMYARMNIKIGEDRGLCIPAAAIQKTGETYLAYVVKNKNSFEERAIEVGPSCGDSMIVRNGLKAGESVVMHGSLELNGLAVKLASDKGGI